MQHVSGWDTGSVEASPYRLMVLRKDVTAAASATLIYIEGDGRAFVTRTQVSGNPTPDGFSALDLAMAGPGDYRAVYLARPCQWVDLATQPACGPDTWTRERFGRPALLTMDTAFRQVAGTGPVVVIGYSGGAAFALELAKRHTNVVGVVTIAGNLSPETTNRWHKVSVMENDIDPLLEPGRLERLPVVHVVGGADTVVPPELTQQVLARTPGLFCTRVIGVAGATHADGWTEWWQAHGDEVLSGLTAGALGCDKPQVP